ncbi:hypothetical protein CB0940_11914 [Cercospora beticola]|uniref:Uncharacterized protein n=1 Tax=Cercospora beticola TaxID=122368 RepID=A0A2G5IEF6_CERBT|nr:hypothetical protein CB0940_11914 [Cercospora beticola]PIB03042.1 hypothetical protein CB0940_11914 [Cercospora beticola]WPB04274.1 hypothetical protein RHO25_008919 [Cercospora beticola]
MATPLHNSPLANETAKEDGTPPGLRLEAPASVTQRSRRLQLRNAGFRGPAVRKITPKSLPAMPTTAPDLSPLFTKQSQSQASDAENVSPSGTRARDTCGLINHDSAGVLQDIGNAADGAGTLRAKRVRQRVTSTNFYTPDVKHGTFGEHLGSSPPNTIVQSNPKSRSIRTRVSKMSTRPRRSISAETRRYVDHLEEELSAAQAQLQAVNSPSVTREQSSNMRHLKAEVARLRDEIDEWETQFDNRLHEEVSKSHKAEQSLRAQLRSVEEECEISKYRIHELESQLRTTTEALDATETANVNMERRIEFFSDLIASSPTKLDLHAQTPGRPGHSRLPSILPRLPTATSLCRSPERQSFTRPTSPMQTRFSPGQPISPHNAMFSPDIPSSDEDFNQSELSGFASNNSQQPNAKRPMRRMRRFGAGSLGPKPLILPSTTHCEHVPASAPPFDRGEYPYDAAFDMHAEDACLEPRSPEVYRRRTVSKTSSTGSPVHLAGSPFPVYQEFASSRGIEAGPNSAALREPMSPFRSTQYSDDDDPLLDNLLGEHDTITRSHANTSNFGSLGSATGAAIGRNLLDELEAAQTLSSADHSSRMFEYADSAGVAVGSSSSPFVSDASGERPSERLERQPKERLSSDSTAALPAMPCTPSVSRLPRSVSSKTLGVQSIRTVSTLDSLRDFFGDVSASPLSVAKYLIQRAQARMRIPRPLLSIQWWLVGVLLGPMAKRRLIARQTCCTQSNTSEQDLLGDTDSSIALHDGLDYGQLYQTPPPSSSPAIGALRSRGLVSGKGKKRASSTSKGRAKSCQHTQRWKHSPLLWLKFSMTLAVAVGIAFKDGPSSLLKEAICNCKTVSSGNWRQTKRDAIVSPKDE